VLVPFAVVDALTAGGWRRIGPFHLALGWSLVLLMVTYTDVGAGFNQLLDVTVLAVIAAGHLRGRLRTPDIAMAPLSLVWALAEL
jgi:hypothetical protein